MQSPRPTRSILKRISAYHEDSEECIAARDSTQPTDAKSCPPRLASHLRRVQFSNSRKVFIIPAISDSNHSLIPCHAVVSFFEPSSATLNDESHAEQSFGVNSTVDDDIASTLSGEENTKAFFSFSDSESESEDGFDDRNPSFAGVKLSSRPTTPSPGSRFGASGSDSSDEEVAQPLYLPSAIGIGEDLFFSSSGDESELSLPTEEYDRYLKTPTPVDDDDNGVPTTSMAGRSPRFTMSNTKVDQVTRRVRDSFDGLSQPSVDDESTGSPRPRTLLRTAKFRGSDMIRSRKEACSSTPLRSFAIAPPTPRVPVHSDNKRIFGSRAHVPVYPSSLSLSPRHPTGLPSRPSASEAGPHPRVFAMRHHVGFLLNTIESGPTEKSSEDKKEEEERKTTTQLRYSRVQVGKQPAWLSRSVDQSKLGRF